MAAHVEGECFGSYYSHFKQLKTFIFMPKNAFLILTLSKVYDIIINDLNRMSVTDGKWSTTREQTPEKTRFRAFQADRLGTLISHGESAPFSFFYGGPCYV